MQDTLDGRFYPPVPVEVGPFCPYCNGDFSEVSSRSYGWHLKKCFVYELTQRQQAWLAAKQAQLLAEARERWLKGS